MMDPSQAADTPTIAQIETDRFCDTCGYNLRGQGVFRDPSTQLLLCRCPECGRFADARDHTTIGYLWLNRLGLLGLSLWVLFVIQAVFSAAVVQGVISAGRLDELTSRQYVAAPGPQTPGSVVQNSTWKYTVKKSTPERTAFVALMLVVSLALGFTLALLLVVACHHWRRWTYVVPILFTGVVAGLIVGWVWFQDAPALQAWGARQITEQTVAYLLGGLLGVWLGRALARLAAVLLLPPRLVQPLAFLWRADGKEPPSAIRKA